MASSANIDFNVYIFVDNLDGDSFASSLEGVDEEILTYVYM